MSKQVRISDDLYERLKLMKANKSFTTILEELIASKSKLTMKDIKEFSEKINKLAHQRFMNEHYNRNK